VWALEEMEEVARLQNGIPQFRRRGSPILVTLMMEIRSSETSVFTSSTRRYVPEDGVLQNISLLISALNMIYSA
jgi:hypothetical protein